MDVSTLPIPKHADQVEQLTGEALYLAQEQERLCARPVTYVDSRKVKHLEELRESLCKRLDVLKNAKRSRVYAA
jgi:hypothetical protein